MGESGCTSGFKKNYFNIFQQKNECFLGYHKIGQVLGVISMHFKILS